MDSQTYQAIAMVAYFVMMLGIGFWAYLRTKNFDDFNPYTHYMTGANGWHSHDADNMWNYGKVQHLSLSQRERGDVIYWPGHVAIYLGNDKIIEAFGDDVHITSLWSHRSSPTGVMRFFVK